MNEIRCNKIVQLTHIGDVGHILGTGTKYFFYLWDDDGNKIEKPIYLNACNIESIDRFSLPILKKSDRFTEFYRNLNWFEKLMFEESYEYDVVETVVGTIVKTVSGTTYYVKEEFDSVRDMINS